MGLLRALTWSQVLAACLHHCRRAHTLRLARVIEWRFWRRKDWNTSSPSSGRSRLDLSRFRFQCRNMAFTTTAFPSVLRDSQPVAILTTSAVVGDVTKYACAQDGQPAPFVIEVDLLDLDSPRELPALRSALYRRGLSPIHVRIDTHAGRCRCVAQERHRQRDAMPCTPTSGVPQDAEHDHRVVAPLVSRHGLDSRNLCADGLSSEALC